MEIPPDVESWDFETLVSASEAALRLKTEAHSVWGFGRHDRWDLNQDKGILRFSNPKLNVVEAPAQVVGTFDIESGTWLWSWANPSINRRLIEHSLVVQAYGERRGFDLLVEPTWTADESECWSMAAVTVMLNRAEGAYCGRGPGLLALMTFGTVRIRGAGMGGG
jgi:hypothetical protein